MLGLSLEDLQPFAEYIQIKLKEWFQLEIAESAIIGYLAKMIYEQDEESLLVLAGLAMLEAALDNNAISGILKEELSDYIEKTPDGKDQAFLSGEVV